MARINIEDAWWVDPRRRKLAILVGSDFEADGVMCLVWRTAQTFWSNGRRTIPEHIWNAIDHSQAVIESGLAEVRDGQIYVRGSVDLLDWAAEQREKARKAGKASAEARKAKTGSAQPKPRTPPEHPFERNRTQPNVVEPSDSGSGSDSGSKKVITEKDTTVVESGVQGGDEDPFGMNSPPPPNFSITPELFHESTKEILAGITPTQQRDWLKTFEHPAWVRETVTKAISRLKARGEAINGGWPLAITNHLISAKEQAQKRNEWPPKSPPRSTNSKISIVHGDPGPDKAGEGLPDFLSEMGAKDMGDALKIARSKR